QSLEVYPIRLYSAFEVAAGRAIVDRDGPVAPVVRRMSVPSPPVEAVEALPLPVVAEVAPVLVAPVSVAPESLAMDADVTPAQPARQAGETSVATAAISGAPSGLAERAQGWPVGGGKAAAGGVEGASSPDQLAEVPAHPIYRENPQPEYPSLARRRQLEGTVVLEVLVGAAGTVGGLKVQQSSGHRLLDEAALKGVKGWRFEPGRRGAAAVAMKVLVPVRFFLR
ncbi:MAG TPA: energy transducer TonB, partial [Desulfurivibrionaceae bacterium]|nr:energy transducer TonB [Desulfurivibrionaceae bacterium]